MTRLILTLAACSLLLSACNGVARPNADICLVNVPELHEKCFNLRDDYDDSGVLKPGAKAHFKTYADEAAMLSALNKNTTFDPDSWAEVKAWINELRDADARRGD